jgi:hypothetical protein
MLFGDLSVRFSSISKEGPPKSGQGIGILPQCVGNRYAVDAFTDRAFTDGPISIMGIPKRFSIPVKSLGESL